MLEIRKSADRGHVNLGWLDTKHTFSFSSYYDKNFMGFENLRVINDDIVEPGKGFGTHPHDNMEIVTYVLDGALEHKDSMGNGSIINAGDVQRMSAGTGITHSEFNHSKSEQVHLLQIWFLPEKRDIEPGYEQKFFNNAEKEGKLRLVASQDGRQGSVSLNQDVDMYAGLFDGSQEFSHQFKDGRNAWLHVAKGNIQVNGQKLNAGDGAKIVDEQSISLTNGEKAEILLFDMKKLT